MTQPPLPPAPPQPPEEEPAAAVPAYYIAAERLEIGGVLAHAPGQRVTPGHVKRHGWQDKVRAPLDEHEE